MYDDSVAATGICANKWRLATIFGADVIRVVGIDQRP